METLKQIFHKIKAKKAAPSAIKKVVKKKFDFNIFLLSMVLMRPTKKKQLKEPQG